MYVYWNLLSHNGENQHGKEQLKRSTSSVHLADHYTRIRTACNKRIPLGAEIIRQEAPPEGLKHCKSCFK